ncbi:MAG: hypothetical protein P1V35_14680 [Planctomycetota bacterium]|nr:hypothetical protein [Planctomycetota bacterium]
MKITITGLLALPLLATACATAPPMGSAPVNPTAGWEAGLGRPGAVLYGRDGSPVGNAGGAGPTNGQMPVQGPTVTDTGDMPHRPTDAGGSRPVLLELFQEAVAERDNLGLELEMTRAALRETEDRLMEMENQLMAEMQAGQAAKATAEKAEGQTYEMGRRLAVAQMRRLEAEKLLLEKTLAERRNMVVEAAE